MRIALSLLRKIGYEAFYKSHKDKHPNDISVWLEFKNANLVSEVLSQFQEAVTAFNVKNPLLETHGMPSFWMFTNIITEQLVENQYLPLLRIIPNNASENVSQIEAIEGQYISLSVRRISAITIKICNEADIDEIVPFDNDVVCILHFMRCS